MVTAGASWMTSTWLEGRYPRIVASLGVMCLALALLLALIGGAFLLLSHLGIDRLPGDIVFERGNVTVYVPVGLMVVVSVLLTVALNLFWPR
jgi:hypothetical protein